MATDIRTKLYVKLAVILLAAVGCVVAFWRLELRLGLDLSGGIELLYRIRTDNVPAADRGQLTQRVIDVLRRRVDPRGTEQLDIRPRGKYRFFIQLPKRTQSEADRVEKLLQQSGTLVFCLVNPNREDLDRAAQGISVGNHTPFIKRLTVDPKTGRRKDRHYKATYQQLKNEAPGAEDWLLVENRALATGQYLGKVYPTTDDMGMSAVGFEFQGKGRAQFADATAANRDRRMAIILDDILYSAPVIRSRIAGPGIIEGRFSEDELNDLITTLQAGSLPADIELEWKNVVGPSLGQDSIRQGKFAMTVAVLLVLGFMGVYYLFAGAVADFTQILNLVLIVGIMVLLRVVLTLPGLAGLVLTIGMAVDANVLIYERIREELSRGKGLRLAIRGGYEGALATIVDSNLTTLITAVILFGVGTGPVRGFAVTLSIGIVCSMFVALVVTRLIFELVMEEGLLKRLPMLELFGRPRLRFSRVRFGMMGASLAVIVAGLVVFGLRGDKKYDTDLLGGIMADMELGRGMSIEEFRKRVKQRYPQADVQSLWEADAKVGALPRRFSVRVKNLSLEAQEEKMSSDLAAAIERNGLGKPGCVRHEKEWAFDIRLTQPTDEGHLRAVLEEAGYRRSDVKRLVAKTARAENFILWLRESEADAEGRSVSAALKALGDLAVTLTLPVEKVGEVQQQHREAEATDERAGRALWQFDVALRDVADPTAVHEAILEQVLHGDRSRRFQVLRADEREAGTEVARNLRVASSDRELLVRMQGSFPKKLEVTSFRLTRASELHVALKSKHSESDVWDRIHQANLDDKVQAVLPRGVGDANYAAYMGPLREDKALERVRDDLLRTFSDEFAKETYKVELSPVEAPAFVGEQEREGFKFFKLKIVGRTMRVQNIAGKLAQAGLPDALVLEKDLRLVAAEPRDEVIIKLKDKPEEIQKAQKEIAAAFSKVDPFRRLENVGQVVAGEMRNKAILAVVLSWIAIVFYIWFRFGELKFGVAAVVALVHDVLVTMGAIAVADALSGTVVGNVLGFSDIKINMDMIAAFLTIIGYSINDTIVVFSRIRENIAGARKRIDPRMIDASINQTLSRTVLTSLTTLFVTVALYLWGGSVIHGFAFAMTVGIITGTYSSIFIASPILIDWEPAMAGLRKVGRVLTFRFD